MVHQAWTEHMDAEARDDFDSDMFRTVDEWAERIAAQQEAKRAERLQQLEALRLIGEVNDGR